MSVEINYYILRQDESGEYRDHNGVLYGYIDSAQQAYDYYVKNLPDKKFKLIERVTTTSVEYRTLLPNETT